MPPRSILRIEPLVRRTPDQVLLLFQQRANVCDWIRGLMAAVFGVKPGEGLPQLIFQKVCGEGRRGGQAGRAGGGGEAA